MKKIIQFIATFLGVQSLCGCSDKNYIPFVDGLFVIAEVSGRKFTGLEEAAEGSGSVTVCMGYSWEGPTCGLRVARKPQGEDWDDYSIEGDYIDAYGIPCNVDGVYSVGDRIIEGSCKSRLPAAEPGWQFDILVNDELFADITMPKRAEITFPRNDSTFSVSEGKDLIMTWPTSGITDVMLWNLWPADLGSGDPCFEKAKWHLGAGGPLSDTGSFTLPADVLPTDLPPDGCYGALELTVEHKGTTSRGTSDGFTLARETSFTLVKFMP